MIVNIFGRNNLFTLLSLTNKSRINELKNIYIIDIDFAILIVEKFLNPILLHFNIKAQRMREIYILDEMRVVRKAIV